MNFRMVHSSQFTVQSRSFPFHGAPSAVELGFTRFTLHASRSSRGFTLLELIIVMVLASLMIGMATLVFVNALPSARLGSTGRDISAAIRQMTMLAQNRGEDQILTINLDTRQYGPEGGFMKTVPANISIMVSDPIIGEIRYGKYPILFHASGGVEGGTVVLGYRKKILFIQTDPVVGSVVIRQ
jgi:general secretion pathway protein H